MDNATLMLHSTALQLCTILIWWCNGVTGRNLLVQYQLVAGHRHRMNNAAKVQSQKLTQ